MNPAMLMALILAGGLALLGLGTGWLQILGLRKLADRRHCPSDEYAYLRARHFRRLWSAALLITIGGMIAGAYLSGMEARADALARAGDRADAGDSPPPGPMAEPDRQFIRIWGVYWIVVIILVFSLFGLAVADAWSSRRYWMAQYRQLKEDHQTRLRRDLEVFRQQRQRNRGSGGGGRLGTIPE
jgi:hypothetical protein